MAGMGRTADAEPVVGTGWTLSVAPAALGGSNSSVTRVHSYPGVHYP